MGVFGSILLILTVAYVFSRIVTFAEESRDRTILAEHERQRKRRISSLYRKEEDS